MATNYPGSTDVFNVPASPTTTPLSSAGTGTRNHVSHHRDLGDAVMSLQNNAAQITHNHNGVGLNSPKLLQVNTHEAPDTDVAGNSLHHTLGLSSTQAAAGNHNHDTRYVRLDGSVDQVLTGKKTFPSGATAIAIPDFQNSKHNHLSNSQGGPTVVNGLITGLTFYNLGPAGATTSIPGNFNTDTFLHANRFTIPANTTVIGYVTLSYYSAWTNQPQDLGRYNSQTHNAFIYVSLNQGESPAFSSAKNVLQNGANFNGQMLQSNANYAVVNTSDRISRILPIYIPSVSTDRTNCILVMRITNTTDSWMGEVNWAINLTFASQSFISL